MNDIKLFKKLHHVCIVVRDIDASISYYESVGVGPWCDYPPMSAYKIDGYGSYEHDAFLRAKYKYANLENVQIQLCQPGEGNTPQRRFLTERGEGVFHLGFSVDDVDAAESTAIENGISVLVRGRLPDNSGYTYFDTAKAGASVFLEVRRNKF